MSDNSDTNLFSLDGPEQFSNSMAWGLQRELKKSGLVESEPNSVTLAKASSYSSLIKAFLLDLSIKESAGDPVYILELSEEPGPLTYYLLKRLFKLYRQSSFLLPPFVYICACPDEEQRDWLSNHPRLLPFIESGALDFTDFQLGKSDTIDLEIREERIEESSLQTPLVLVADNSLSALPCELLYSDGELLADSFLTINSSSSLEEIAFDRLDEELSFDYNYGELDSDKLDPTTEALVEQYREAFPYSHIPLPLRAVEGLKELRSFSTEGILLLSSDRGPQRAAELEELPPPQALDEMPGFNFHFLKSYIEEESGLALLPKYKQYTHGTAAMLWLPEASSYRETVICFDELFERLSPDDLGHIYNHLEESGGTLSIPQALSYLRLSGYDYRLFYTLYHNILAQSAKIDEIDSLSLLQTAGNLWDNYFPVESDNELPLMLGNLLLRLKFFSEALTFYRITAELDGREADLVFNMALCNYYMDEKEETARLVKEVLSLNSDHKEANELKKML